MDSRRTQCHFWLNSDDHDFLRKVAKSEGLPVGAILRRAVRRLRAAGNGDATIGRPAGGYPSDPSLRGFDDRR